MPGDVPYQVQLPPGAVLPADAGAGNRGRAERASRGTRRCGTPSPMRRTVSRAPSAVAPAPPPGDVPRHRRPVLRLPVVERSDLDAVARQLGREPRGVLEIAYRCPNGEPGVVKTAPRLPDGTPFPTLYYLTHPALTAAASRLESSGLMREMTERLGDDPELAAAYRQRARVVSGRARRDRVAGHDVLRRRHAGPGQVPARGDRALAGQGPRRQSVRRRGAGGAGRRTGAWRGSSTGRCGREQGRCDRLRHQLDPAADRRRGRRRAARRAPRDAHRAAGPRCRRHGAIRARGARADPGRADRLRRTAAQPRCVEGADGGDVGRPATPPTATCSSR